MNRMIIVAVLVLSASGGWAQEKDALAEAFAKPGASAQAGIGGTRIVAGDAAAATNAGTRRTAVFTESTLKGPLHHVARLETPPGAASSYREAAVLAFARPPAVPLGPEFVLDVTKQVDAGGTLTIDIPEGEWTVLRVGHVAADGIDFLSAAATEQYFQQQAAGRTSATFLVEAGTSGASNWTAGLLEEFRARRGYDATRWLPALAGYTLRDADLTARFHHDFGQTIADCRADRFYGRFTELAHAAKMATAGKSAGGEALKDLGRVDVPMGECTVDETGRNASCKVAASAAHLYGKPIAAAELLRSAADAAWREVPADWKRPIDAAFCAGINQIELPSFGTGAPPKPAWWKLSPSFFAYLARCSALLQHGQFVADVLCLVGPGGTNTVDRALGPGFDYDMCNEEILLRDAAVKDGRIVLPSGVAYRVLALPDTTNMPLAVARKLRDLVSAGATIVGPRPARDPGLLDHPRADDALGPLAFEVWGPPTSGREPSLHRFGEGRVFEHTTLRAVLDGDGVSPDFVASESDALDYTHRRDGDADIYFVANRTDREVAGLCSFRVDNRRPELFDPVTGTRRELVHYAVSNDWTSVPLEFPALGSLFVVFRHGHLVGEPDEFEEAQLPVFDPAARNFPTLSEAAPVAGPWSVRFDPTLGGPSNAVFEKLVDWTEREEPGIRHYAGPAVYETTLAIAEPGARRYWIDLGDVKHLATVRVNGRLAGTVWTAPWRVEITKRLKAGENKLEIEVANQWPNRLIGDAALPPAQRVTRTRAPFKPDDPLLPSGLLGPVRLLVENGKQE